MLLLDIATYAIIIICTDFAELLILMHYFAVVAMISFFAITFDGDYC